MNGSTRSVLLPPVRFFCCVIRTAAPGELFFFFCEPPHNNGSDMVHTLMNTPGSLLGRGGGLNCPKSMLLACIILLTEKKIKKIERVTNIHILNTINVSKKTT